LVKNGKLWSSIFIFGWWKWINDLKGIIISRIGWVKFSKGGINGEWFLVDVEFIDRLKKDRYCLDI
jgi:hypothetical protein